MEIEIISPKRLSYCLRYYCDEGLSFPIPREDDFTLKKRLDRKTDLLTSKYTWRKLQTLLEREAISRISVKEHLSKLYNIAQELSEMTSQSCDKLVVLLLHLFLQESVASVQLKQIMKHVLGSHSSSVILHRIYKIVHELKHSLPPYILEQFCGLDGISGRMFGEHIQFVPLDRNKMYMPDLTNLHEIELEEEDEFHVKELEGAEDFADESESPPSSPSDLLDPYDKLRCYRFDDIDYEEVRFQVIPKCLYKFGRPLPVSQLDEVCQCTFKYKRILNGTESAVYKTLFNSKGNVLINLPLAFDKTTLLALAVLNVTKHNCDYRQHSKVLYLVPSIESAEYMTPQLRRYLNAPQIKVAHFTTSAELNYNNMIDVQVIVTTASLWETQNLDRDLFSIKMLIIDEMNCLRESSGPAFEVIIARMLRQIEHNLDVRIVGFTMSLLSVHSGPSFNDLVQYLQVEENNALIISEHYMPMLPNVFLITIKVSDYEKCHKSVEKVYERTLNINFKGRRVIVFVKGREDIVDTIKTIQNNMNGFQREDLALRESIKTKLMNLMKVQSDDVSMDLCLQGYLTLHSGLSSDVRDYLCAIFKEGLAKIIVATLNYAPMLSGQADTVIIKDIDSHNEKMDSLIDEVSSFGKLLAVATSHLRTLRRQVIFIVDARKLNDYQSVLQNQIVIKSKLLDVLPDTLHNEIVLNSVKNVRDCEEWFRYTFLFYSMRKELALLGIYCLDAEVHQLMSEILKTLEKSGMIKYLRRDHFRATDLSYVAHCNQVSYTTLEFLGKYAEKFLDNNDIKVVLCDAPVFSSLMTDESQDYEISTLADSMSFKNCENWKIRTLLEVTLSGKMVSPRLECHQAFIIQEFKRLIRIMFEMYLTKKNATMVQRCLKLAFIVEECMRESNKIPEKLPQFSFEGYPQLISKFLMKVNFLIRPSSSWKEEDENSPHLFWLWIEDVTNNLIHNYTCVELTRKADCEPNLIPSTLRYMLPLNQTGNSPSSSSNIPYIPKLQVEKETCMIVGLPIKVALPVHSQYKGYLLSCKLWECLFTCTITFDHMAISNDTSAYTDLLKLRPLPVSTLQNDVLEEQFSSSLFSPVITQAFHSLYHRDCNVLLTSTIEDLITAAEIVISRAVAKHPGAKVVYVTKWMSEVEKRFISWKSKFENLGLKVMAFSGKTEEDIENFSKNDIILSTACHWELASRSQQIRRCLAYAKVRLIVVNDLHLLDTDMESALLRILGSPQQNFIRVLGLSQTSIACAGDIVRFLRIPPESPAGVYNFGCHTDSIMPNAVEVLGFLQREFSARSRAMSVALWDIIQNIESGQRVIILVPSREEVLPTAMTLKKFILSSKNPEIWKCPSYDNLDSMIFETQDMNVSDMLKHGIGLLESGMSEYDLNIMQTILHSRTVTIFILSMDLAGYIRLKNHLLIIKGTEVLDAKMDVYVDIPVSVIVNKMYSCGSIWKKAIILTSYSKETLFRTHFQGPLLLESQLPDVLVDHINSEIAAGVISTKEAAIEYISHSFLACRVASNPCFYYMGEIHKKNPEECIPMLVEKSLFTLQEAGCVTAKETDLLQSSILGILSYIHRLSYTTMKLLGTNLKPDMTIQEMVLMVCNADEFKKLPSRNEDKHLKVRLKNQCRWSVDLPNDSPLVEKVFILLQSNFSKAEKTFPNFVDYESDMKEVVDIALKIVQVVVIICCDKSWLKSALFAQQLVQMLITGCWGAGIEPVFTLPHVTPHNWKLLLPKGCKLVRSLPQLQHLYSRPHYFMFSSLRKHFVKEQINEIREGLTRLPRVNIEIKVCRNKKCWKIKPKKYKSCNSNLVLYAEREYVLAVELEEAGSENRNSWTLIFGSQKKEEVIAMQRLKYGMTKSLVTFRTPKEEGEVTYTLYLLSNEYIGLDQQFDVYLKIVCK